MVAIVQTISITKDRDTLEKLVMVPVPWKHFLSMDVSHFVHLFYVTAVVSYVFFRNFVQEIGMQLARIDLLAYHLSLTTML